MLAELLLAKKADMDNCVGAALGLGFRVLQVGRCRTVGGTNLEGYRELDTCEIQVTEILKH